MCGDVDGLDLTAGEPGANPLECPGETVKSRVRSTGSKSRWPRRPRTPFPSEAVIQCRHAQRQTARLGLPPFIAAGYGLANQEHTAILAAIQAGDVDRAGQAARNHIDRTEAENRQEIMTRLCRQAKTPEMA